MVSLTITLRSKRDSRDRRISLGILASIGIPMPRRVFPHDAWKSVAPHPCRSRGASLTRNDLNSLHAVRIIACVRDEFCVYDNEMYVL